MEGLNKSDLKTISDVMQVIQIAIDHYDDLFSDFDPSSYETRLLSDDFLKELHRRYSERKKKEFTVNFTIPKSTKSEKIEVLVKKRLKEYFKQKLKTTMKIRKDKMTSGAIRVVLGIFFSMLLFIFPQLDTVPLLTLISVLLWYALWSGFERIFESSRRLLRKTEFYEKFTKAQYNFVTEEEMMDIIQKIQDTQMTAKQETSDNSTQKPQESS